MHGVVGLDLSLSNTGMCFVPPDWEGDVGSLVVASFKTTREKMAYGKPHVLARIDTERYLQIADKVIRFVKECGVRDVAVEGYAYSPVRTKKGQPVQSSSMTKLAELGGVVKSQLLLSCQSPAVPVASNTARKFVTGGLKRGKQKQQIEQFLRERGIVFDNWDIMDAFVVAYCWYGQINDIRSRYLPQCDLGF
jgi:hypothetical protein